jgi:hypothetical protein
MSNSNHVDTVMDNDYNDDDDNDDDGKLLDTATTATKLFVFRLFYLLFCCVLGFS